jgi:cytosine deaminase
MDQWLTEAISEARAGLAEAGSPVGAVLVKAGEIIGRGRNRLYQSGDPTTHAEMEAYRDAAHRMRGKEIPDEVEARLAGCIVYTTAVPCEMCAGAIVRFKASQVIVAEATTYPLPETREFFQSLGIEMVVLETQECIDLVQQYFQRYPERRLAWVACRPGLGL